MLHLVSSCSDNSPSRSNLSGALASGHTSESKDHAEKNCTSVRDPRFGRKGFTLLELIIAIGIVAVLAAIAIPMYGDYKEKIKIGVAIQDISHIQTTIDQFALENRYTYPGTLADVKMDTMVDPWNTPYQYTNLSTGKKGKGDARKDKNLVPINSDYDLWSNGKDGKSVAPLTAKASRDDIVRANNGRYVGIAADY